MDVNDYDQIIEDMTMIEMNYELIVRHDKIKLRDERNRNECSNVDDVVVSKVSFILSTW